MSAFGGAAVWGKLFDLPVEMRSDGATVGFSSPAHLSLWNASAGSAFVVSGVSGPQAGKRSVSVYGGVSVGGSPGFSPGQALFMIFNTTSGWIDASVEI